MNGFSDEDLMRELKGRAYREGYNLGLYGRPAHAGDWEPEYRQSYLDGFNKGRDDRSFKDKSR